MLTTVLVDVNYLKRFRKGEGLPPLTPEEVQEKLLPYATSKATGEPTNVEWVAYDAAPAAVPHPEHPDYASHREAEFEAFRRAGWEVRLGRCITKTVQAPVSGEAVRSFERRGVSVLTALDLLTRESDLFVLVTGDSDLAPVVEDVVSNDDARVVLLTDVARTNQRLIDAASSVYDLAV